MSSSQCGVASNSWKNRFTMKSAMILNNLLVDNLSILFHNTANTITTTDMIRTKAKLTGRFCPIAEILDAGDA
jgi:hypothetical protein